MKVSSTKETIDTNFVEVKKKPLVYFHFAERGGFQSFTQKVAAHSHMLRNWEEGKKKVEISNLRINKFTQSFFLADPTIEVFFRKETIDNHFV